jgi:hypothetical protein
MSSQTGSIASGSLVSKRITEQPGLQRTKKQNEFGIACQFSGSICLRCNAGRRVIFTQAVWNQHITPLHRLLHSKISVICLSPCKLGEELAFAPGCCYEYT